MSDIATSNKQQAQSATESRSLSKEQEQQEYTDLINSLPTRWEIELEFVQSLSNIPYLSYLAQNNYLQDPCFVNYLKYLQYWAEPQYSRYLVYPNCLHILSLLQSEQFRRDIVNPDIMNVLMNDMVKRWQDNGDGDLNIKDGTTNGENEEGKNKNESEKEKRKRDINRRNGSEGVVETIDEEQEDTEPNGGEMKDEDGDVKISE
ncbi:SOH1 [Candida margitis]|uniref:SOH1 n=1 Tax=Candida margitis TaxID=1775924 RepID=UPI0022275FC7|nr:SOH1 [Candida margitis]KAI5959435.1 SOH1 [Candida margitis]